MPITFNCPGCGKGYSVPDVHAGKQTKCRACGTVLTIPMARQAAFAAAPMPAAGAAPDYGYAPAEPARKRGFPIKAIALIVVALLIVGGIGYGAYALLGGS